MCVSNTCSWFWSDWQALIEQMSWQGLQNSTAVMQVMSIAGGSLGFSLVRDLYASSTPQARLQQCIDLLAEVNELLGELTHEERVRITLRDPEFLTKLDEKLKT